MTESRSLAHYFFNNYTQCREEFRTLARHLQSIYPQGIASSIPVACTHDNDLTIDLLYIPPALKKDKLVIISSGLHGIEGFTGNAIQRLFLEQSFPADIDHDHTGIVVIHAVNPYGFKYKRRVTEQNIDLNRNFSTTKAHFLIQNAGYRTLARFLNPQKAFSSRAFSHRFFKVRIIPKIIRYGIPLLKEAVLKGQFECAKGIFYGGNDFTEQKLLLEDYLKPLLYDYRMILVLDLHTGYGTRGLLQWISYMDGRVSALDLYSNTEREKLLQAKKLQDSLFSGIKIQGVDYEVVGAFPYFIHQLSGEKQVCLPMGIEYGTMDSQKPGGMIQSLRNMIMENQMTNFGYKNAQDKAYMETVFNEMFYPSDPQWRKDVLAQTMKILPLLLKRFRTAG